MGRPEANEEVRLRKPIQLLGERPWKVTARYSVWTSATKTMRCVRVSCYGTSNQCVLHVTEKEFARLFKPLRPNK